MVVMGAKEKNPTDMGWETSYHFRWGDQGAFVKQVTFG